MNAKLEIQSWKPNNLRWWIRVWVEDVCPGLNLNTQRLILVDLVSACFPFSLVTHQVERIVLGER